MPCRIFWFDQKTRFSHSSEPGQWQGLFYDTFLHFCKKRTTTPSCRFAQDPEASYSSRLLTGKVKIVIYFEGELREQTIYICLRPPRSAPPRLPARTFALLPRGRPSQRAPATSRTNFSLRSADVSSFITASASILFSSAGRLFMGDQSGS